MSVKTDEQLMAAYREGDPQAFDELYRRHSPKVWGFLVKRISNEGLREEVFQEVFLKLHRSKHLYDPSLSFAPWLFTVTRSVMNDAFRKGLRQVPLSDQPEDLDHFEAPTNSPSETPDLSQLTKAQKVAVELRYFEEKSFEEIAEILETSSLNVRQLISRALKKLRAKGGSL